MKGYFSRIAKQSGLRFSGQPGLPRPFLEGETAGEPAPLHLEERVMIPPHLSAEKTETPRPPASAKSTASEASQKMGNVPESGREETGFPVVEEKTIRMEKKPDDGFGSEDRQEFASPARSEEFSAPVKAVKTVKTKRSASAEKPAGEFSAIEKTVFTETRGADEAFSQAGERNEESALKEPLELTKRERSGPTAGRETGEIERKEYFVKTAEIIEKGETAEAAEVQKILFQEVQQWVADSPAALDPGEPESGEKIEQLSPREVRQPRISELPELITVREKVEPENTGRGEFAEQNFELSIGTISVVIEEPERPRQPELPPASASQNTARETKREYSRLSRHYL